MAAEPDTREEPYTVEALRQRVTAGWEPKYLFFWGHTSRGEGVTKACLSQWYPARFVVDGRAFPTAEHFMMFEKARLFGDDEAAQRILAADHPGDAKKLGRAVRGFDEARWRIARFEIVTAGSLAKFSQCPALRSFLLGTTDRVLVEASPRDPVWGIGLSENDAAARDPDHWRGLNLLGFALMRARHDLAD
jgi:ribA/ribD-fused uncharacterized protein